MTKLSKVMGAMALVGILNSGSVNAQQITPPSNNLEQRVTSLSSPALISPAHGEQVSTLGPLLKWDHDDSATQYHIQVKPAGDDGPGMNLIIANSEAVKQESFQIEAPELGNGNYVMLPAMEYLWRVRVANANITLGENDLSWGQWSEQRKFNTKMPPTNTITPVYPANGAPVNASRIQVQWRDSNSANFYYEIQISPDPAFGAGGSKEFVWHNFAHGGFGPLLNDFIVNVNGNLEEGKILYWRVKPRLQGYFETNPLPWSDSYTMSVKKNFVAPEGTFEAAVRGNAHEEMWHNTILQEVTGENAAKNVRIEFTNIATGTRKTVLTRDDGFYLAALPTGKYLMSIEGSGSGEQFYYLNTRATDEHATVRPVTTVSIRDPLSGAIKPLEVIVDANIRMNLPLSVGLFRSPISSLEWRKKISGQVGLSQGMPYVLMDLHQSKEGTDLVGMIDYRGNSSPFSATSSSSDCKVYLTNVGPVEGQDGFSYCTIPGEVLYSMSDGIVKRIGTTPSGARFIEVEKRTDEEYFVWKFQHIARLANVKRPDGTGSINERVLQVGDVVAAGEVIAVAGSTGLDLSKTAPHTYVEMWHQVGDQMQLLDPHKWEGFGSIPRLGSSRTYWQAPPERLAENLTGR